MRRLRITAYAGLATWALCGTLARAAAPELSARFLRPQAFAIAVGDSARVGLLDGGGTAVDLGQQKVQWAFVRVAGTQHNFDAPVVNEGGGGSWVFPMEAAGVGVVGVDLAPRSQEVERAELRAFLQQRGTVPKELPQGERGRVQVQRIESFKAIIRAGEAGREQGATAAIGKTGQQAEIRPLMDPTALAIGSDMPLRVYAAGSGASEARVIATHLATKAVQEIRCDGSGIGLMRLSEAGVWQLESHTLHHVEEEPRQGQWQLISATLTFEAQEVKP